MKEHEYGSLVIFYLRRTHLAVAVGHELIERDAERPDVRGFVKLSVDQTLRCVPG